MDKERIFARVLSRAYYGEWEEVSSKRALMLARWLFNRMPLGNDESRTRKTNRHFQGIEFTLDELRGE